MIIKGRIAILKIINNNLKIGHRITKILNVLKIPRSTYYGYIHWQPGKALLRRNFIKQKVLDAWLKYPMYGYPRLTILLNCQLKIHSYFYVRIIDIGA